MHRRIAIVGAGPAGLFAAQALTRQDRVPVEIDILDRLPTPYGLLRYGVAPDHESIRSVARTLEATFEDSRVRFFGLVEFGTTVTAEDLLTTHDAVIYAVGASEDLRLGVPGEDLAGSRSAREFVAWYGGHPDAEHQDLSGVSQVVTVGVGNVAVDVARILAKDVRSLESTDMPEAVLSELRGASVTDVHVVGRRGPQDASFTTRELRDLVSLNGVAVHIDEEVFAGIDDNSLDRRQKANVAALRDAAARDVTDPRVRLHFRFWRRPCAVEGNGSVGRVVLEGTTYDDNGRVTGTGTTEPVDAQLLLRAIGYRSVPIPGVPFDDGSGIIPNEEGRVVDLNGTVRPREYVVGWIKRGPIGVIGTNKSDAAQTVAHLLDDLDRPGADAPTAPFLEMLTARGVQPSTFEDWQRINEAEMWLGASRGRERTKIEQWHQLLELSRQD